MLMQDVQAWLIKVSKSKKQNKLPYQLPNDAWGLNIKDRIFSIKESGSVTAHFQNEFLDSKLV